MSTDEGAPRTRQPIPDGSRRRAGRAVDEVRCFSIVEVDETHRPVEPWMVRDARGIAGRERVEAGERPRNAPPARV